MSQYQEACDQFRSQPDADILAQATSLEARARVSMAEAIWVATLSRKKISKLDLHGAAKLQLSNIKTCEGGMAIMQPALRQRAENALAFK